MKEFLKLLLKDTIIMLFAGAGICAAVFWIREYLNSDA